MSGTTQHQQSESVQSLYQSLKGAKSCYHWDHRRHSPRYGRIIAEPRS